MPNWCSNKIIFHGDKKEIKKTYATIKSDKELFDFNRIIAMPACLNIRVPEHVIDLAKQTSPDLSQLSTSDIALYKQCVQNIKRTGYAYWNDWRLDKWGTCWNASDTEIKEDTILFQTAWDEPIPIVKQLTKYFPTVLMDWYYLHEGEDFVHEKILYRGKTIREIEHMPYDQYWAMVYFDFFPDEKEDFVLYNFPDSTQFYFRWQKIYGVEELDEDTKGEFYTPF